jgi:hypothetical protein
MPPAFASASVIASVTASPRKPSVSDGVAAVISLTSWPSSTFSKPSAAL